MIIESTSTNRAICKQTKQVLARSWQVTFRSLPIQIIFFSNSDNTTTNNYFLIYNAKDGRAEAIVYNYVFIILISCGLSVLI